MPEKDLLTARLQRAHFLDEFGRGRPGERVVQARVSPGRRFYGGPPAARRRTDDRATAEGDCSVAVIFAVIRGGGTGCLRRWRDLSWENHAFSRRPSEAVINRKVMRN